MCIFLSKTTSSSPVLFFWQGKIGVTGGFALAQNGIRDEDAVYAGLTICMVATEVMVQKHQKHIK